MNNNRTLHKVAVAQLDVSLGSRSENVEQIVAAMRAGSEQGAELIVFPEGCVTGYVTDSAEQSYELAIRRDAPELNVIRAAAVELNQVVVVGLLEVDDGGDVYNTTSLVSPHGEDGYYRKVHLPHVGADRFVRAGGDAPTVLETPVGRIGLCTCYDLRFPEWTRALALRGAQIIAHSTAWLRDTIDDEKILLPARALENRVFVLSSNRAGAENGVEFGGNSCIISPLGRVLDVCHEREGLAVATIDVSLAHKPVSDRKGDAIERGFVQERRPELYGELVVNK